MPTKKSKKRRTKKQQKQQWLSAVVALGIGIASAIIYQAFFPPIPPPPDERPGRIDAYFEKHNAPLAGHGETFVEAVDNCVIGMDWRLLPAIAMRESSGGKRMQLNNPFGWGSAEIPFESIDDAILGVGKHLCGSVTSTAKWYSTTSTERKLYYYNGTVIPTYPAEVMWIMDQI